VVVDPDLAAGPDPHLDRAVVAGGQDLVGDAVIVIDRVGVRLLTDRADDDLRAHGLDSWLVEPAVAAVVGGLQDVAGQRAWAKVTKHRLPGGFLGIAGKDDAPAAVAELDDVRAVVELLAVVAPGDQLRRRGENLDAVIGPELAAGEPGVLDDVVAGRRAVALSAKLS
jgi:hypothetical protein